MRVLLVNLRGVPDDEADEIRALLTEQSVRFYETSAGRWGLSQPGIWLPDTSQLADARAMLDTYQAQRLASARAGQRPISFVSRLRQAPVRVMLLLLAAGALLSLFVAPFLYFGTT
ncbi:MAG: hypothetical protein IPM37_01320 [Hahellaceae bacterium]|nr:hypothetical protein [Hahellaceae bacterium]